MENRSEYNANDEYLKNLYCHAKCYGENSNNKDIRWYCGFRALDILYAYKESDKIKKTKICDADFEKLGLDGFKRDDINKLRNNLLYYNKSDDRLMAELCKKLSDALEERASEWEYEIENFEKLIHSNAAPRYKLIHQMVEIVSTLYEKINGDKELKKEIIVKLEKEQKNKNKKERAATLILNLKKGWSHSEILERISTIFECSSVEKIVKSVMKKNNEKKKSNDSFEEVQSKKDRKKSKATNSMATFAKDFNKLRKQIVHEDKCSSQDVKMFETKLELLDKIVEQLLKLSKDKEDQKEEYEVGEYEGGEEQSQTFTAYVTKNAAAKCSIQL